MENIEAQIYSIYRKAFGLLIQNKLESGRNDKSR